MVKARWSVPAAVRGPLAAYAVGFWEELVGRGYAPCSAEAHLLLMARMSRWMQLVTPKPATSMPVASTSYMAWGHDTGAWTGGGLPRGVDAVSVTRLLAACDRRTAKGQQTSAILMILTRLGRAGEVVALELGDLDWPEGRGLVRGKARRIERMPSRLMLARRSPPTCAEAVR